METFRLAGPRSAGLAAVMVALTATATGCSSDESLMVAGFSNVLDGDRRPAYFTFSLCSESGEPADITITDVTAIGLQGTKEPLEFGVAWADGPQFTRAMSSHGPLPDAFSDAIGAEGAVGECGEPDEYALLSVAFPPVGRRPILLTDVEVTYEVDGDSHTATAEAFLAQCPADTEAGDIGDDSYQELCRKSRSDR